MPARQLYRTGLNVIVVLAATAALSACGSGGLKSRLSNIKNPFWQGGTPEPVVAQTIGPVVAQPEAVVVGPVDPLNAPPPGPATTAMADPLLVPAPSAAPAPDSSQRVPLGTLGTAPPGGAPVSLTQPPLTQPPLTQPPLTQPAAQPIMTAPVMPTVTAPAKSNMPQQMASAVPARTAVPEAPPDRPAAPSNALIGRPSNASPLKPERKVELAQDEEPQETVVISSATAKPAVQGREFVPASLVPGERTMPLRGLDDMPMTAGEKNIVQRFETLRRLKEESLITEDEYNRRRNANIGALLPYTRDPGGVGLERSVPGSDAIIARLAALRRAFEMRAISASQHALERTMILNALLPEAPDDRADQKPPPADVIEGASMVGRLEGLRAKNLITVSEMDAEKNAIERVLRTGLLPSQETATTRRAASGAKPAAAKPKAPTPDVDASSAEITGPVLHLASYRSEESAKQGWVEVTSHNKAALASLKPIIRKVDLGAGQGIFYRLMAGTFNSLSEAEAVCIQLKQNNQFCRASADGS